MAMRKQPLQKQEAGVERTAGPRAPQGFSSSLCPLFEAVPLNTAAAAAFSVSCTSRVRRHRASPEDAPQLEPSPPRLARLHRISPRQCTGFRQS